MSHEDWPEATATINLCKYRRPWRSVPGFYMVTFTYVVNGVNYDGALECGEEMLEGEKFPIRYDPNNPERNNKEVVGSWASWYTGIFTAAVLVLLVYFWLKR